MVYATSVNFTISMNDHLFSFFQSGVVVVWCDATGDSGSQLPGLGNQTPRDGELCP